MQLPITIGLRRSSFQRAILLAVALLASVAVVGFPRPWPLRAVCLLLLWGWAWIAWHRLLPPLSAIRLESGGQILAALADSQEFQPVELLPGATVHPWLTVLRLEFAGGERRTLLVTTGTTQADDFRRLRLFLRWRGSLSGSGGGL